MYSVTLTAKGPERIPTIRQLRAALGLSLVAGLNLADKAELPFVLLDGVDLATAERVREILSSAHAQVDISQSDTACPMIFYRPDFLEPPTNHIKSPISKALTKWLFGSRRHV